MKNNKGITLVALIITIIVMMIIVGISVSGGSDILQKSKMTDYIGYMKLVKARANAVIEEEIFNNGEPSDSVNSFEESDVTNTIADKGYYIPTMKTIKWEQNDISSQGIDKNILGGEQYFVIVYDTENMETRDVLYSAGCGLEGQRYYSLNDMETVIKGGTPTVATTRPIVNLIKDGGFENKEWGNNGSTVRYDEEYTKSGLYSLMLQGNSAGNEITSQYGTNYKLNENHKYYISVFVKENSDAENRLGFYYQLGEPSAFLKITNLTENGWNKYSGVFEIGEYAHTEYIRIDNDNLGGNRTVYLDELHLVDLTTTFAGIEEPEEGWKNWCDENLDYNRTVVDVPQN